ELTVPPRRGSADMEHLARARVGGVVAFLHPQVMLPQRNLRQAFLQHALRGLRVQSAQQRIEAGDRLLVGARNRFEVEGIHCTPPHGWRVMSMRLAEAVWIGRKWG